MAAVGRPAVALLGDRTFGPWFWGTLVSNTGNWLYNVTAAVVVFNLTGSALYVGLVSVVQFAMLVLFAPWAGVLCDRVDRRKLLLASHSVATVSAVVIAVVIGILRVEGLPGAWPVLAATFGIGAGQAFAKPAQQAIVPALVPDRDLETAVSLTAVTFTLGRALGPAAAGGLLVTLGAETAFAINAVTFFGLIAALLVIRQAPRPALASGADAGALAGLRHARRDPVILWLLCGIAVIGFGIDPFITLVPPLAQVFDGGDTLAAALASAGGLGAALGSATAGGVQRRWGGLRVARAGLGIMGAGFAATALIPHPAGLLAGFFVAGAGSMFSLTSLTSALHRRVDDHVRGRVMALWSLAFLGVRPVGAVVNGAAADLVGARAALVCVVVAALAGMLLVGVLLRHERDRVTATPAAP